MKKAVSLLLTILLTFSLLLPCFNASAESFASVLESFPESYREPLKKLHKEYPNWTFSPVNTGLSWDEAVEKEGGHEGVVPSSSAYSDMLKSMSSDYYNYSTGTFISKSRSTVVGSDFAISYFLDPRNFLTVQGIFQFEKLSFDPSITQSDVEDALRGTFMYKTGASYYDRSGNYVKVDTLYSKIIFKAGEKYNINPLYLAAKIIGEIGAHGSTPTYGTNSSYPGIYNFYNIGAYDGANASVKGLAWASSGETYGRPWTTPKKSIFGGADFLAGSYIGVGQNTSYFQKFNVQPGSYYQPYYHQYMTTIWGAAEIGYQTYLSYKRNDTLGAKRSFLIPVFDDMPEIGNCEGDLSLLDAKGQSATVRQTCNLRSGPDEYTNVIGSVPEGKSVKILGCFKTSSLYPDSFLMYPVWAKISFSQNGETKTGFIYFNFLTLKSVKIVKVGTYTPVQIKSNNELQFRFLSRNETIAKANGTKIKFLKPGTVDVYAYDSLGRFSCVRYSVRESVSGKTIDGLKASDVTTSGAKISWKKNPTFEKYRVTVLDSQSRPVFEKVTSGTSLSLKGLSENEKYLVYVNGIIDSKCSASGKPLSFTTEFVPPKKVTGAKAVQSDDLLSIELSWKDGKAAGYTVCKYNESKKKYVEIGSTTLTEFSFEDVSAIKGASFKIRAYKFVKGKKVFGKYSDVVKYSPGDCRPAKVSSFSAKGTSSKSIRLSWKSVKNATAYRVFIFDEEIGTYKKIKLSTETKFTVKNLQPLKEYKFRIVPITTIYGTTFSGKATNARTFTLPGVPEKIKSRSLSDGKTKVSWEKVDGATGYAVYMFNKSSGTYKLFKKVSSNSFTFTFLSGKTSASFKIKSIAVIGDEKFVSKSTPAFNVKK